MPSFVKLSRTVSKLWSGHEQSTADGWTDGQTDRQTDRHSLFVAGHKNGRCSEYDVGFPIKLANEYQEIYPSHHWLVLVFYLIVVISFTVSPG